MRKQEHLGGILYSDLSFNRHTEEMSKKVRKETIVPRTLKNRLLDV